MQTRQNRANIWQRQKRQLLIFIAEEILPCALQVIASAKGLLSAQPRATSKIIKC